MDCRIGRISFNPPIACPKCNLKMRLFGIEAESYVWDLYTFECRSCDALEVRGVLLDAYRTRLLPEGLL